MTDEIAMLVIKYCEECPSRCFMICGIVDERPSIVKFVCPRGLKADFKRIPSKTTVMAETHLHYIFKEIEEAKE